MTTETYRGFTFRYVQDPEYTGKVKIYVEDNPSYEGRDTTSSVIHVYPGKNGSPPYICFKPEYKPSSLQEAIESAQMWADRTLEYIETGIEISDQSS